MKKLIVSDRLTKEQCNILHQHKYNLIVYNTDTGDSKAWLSNYNKPSENIHPLRSNFWSTIINNTDITSLTWYINSINTLDTQLPTFTKTLKSTIISLTHQDIRQHIITPDINKTLDFSNRETCNAYKTTKGINTYYGMDPTQLYYRELTQLERELKATAQLKLKENLTPRELSQHQQTTINTWAKAYGLDLPPLDMDTIQIYNNAYQSISYYTKLGLETNDTHRICSCGYPITPLLDHEYNQDKDNQVYILQTTIPCPKCGATYTLDDFYPETIYTYDASSETITKHQHYSYQAIQTKDYYVTL